MNRSIVVSTLILTVLTVAISGCKYPEGPFVSIQSPEARVANTWEVLKATDKDGTDITSDLDGLEFILAEDRSATASIPTVIGTFDFEGTWDLDNDDTEFEVDLVDKATGLVPYDRRYEILRLTADEFWLMDTSDSTEIQLETK